MGHNAQTHFQGGGNLISRGLGVYEADGDGDDNMAEGEDCLDSGDLPPAALAVRDAARGASTSAHGSIASDSVPAPPLLIGKNTSSTHVDNSLFRAGGNSVHSTSEVPATSRAQTLGAGPRQDVELRGDVFSDSGRSDTLDDTLQCPRCKKGYPTRNHVDFLDHVDKCCD